MTTRTHLRRLACVVLLVIAGSTPALRAEEIGSVRLLVGRSAVVNVASPISRVSLTSADIADALVTTPNQLLIQGKVPGTITMFVWDRGGVMTRYDVTVERDLSTLTTQVAQLFPGEPIVVASNGRSVVVSGVVSSKYVADKAVEVAAGHVEKKEDVVNMLQVRSVAPPQVMLRVRFAEISRSALTELGASFFTGPNGYKNFVGRSTTQQYPAPIFDNDGNDNKLVFSDFLNLFLFDTKNQLGGLIKALQTRGLFQSLAEPNLVAESGKEASFLAGGEIPIPVAQGSGANIGVSVMFKEFGIRLNFTPTVAEGGRVRLKVRPEVSTLDFTNAVTLSGFRIPALSTRRTETELELQDGQTFAIAGLLNSTATESLQRVPGIGDIPILGYLFRSKAAQKNRTELVVMITPVILPPNSPGITSELPRMQEPFLAPTPLDKSFPTPGPAFTPQQTTPRTSANDAAEALRSRMGKAPTMISADALTAPAPARTEPPVVTEEPAAAASPEMRPLTKDEQKRLDKSREAERKAEEKRVRDEEKQAREDEKRRREEDKAAKREQEKAEKEAREREKKSRS